MDRVIIITWVEFAFVHVVHPFIQIFKLFRYFRCGCIVWINSKNGVGRQEDQNCSKPVHFSPDFKATSIWRGNVGNETFLQESGPIYCQLWNLPKNLWRLNAVWKLQNALWKVNISAEQLILIASEELFTCEICSIREIKFQIKFT